MPEIKNIRMLIVAHPGTWQRVLQMNIEAYPFVKVVDVASGSLSAAQLANQHYPDLMLIDSSIPFDDALALIQIIKREIPETRSIVITDTTQQRRRITRAGADYTLSSFDFDSQLGEILNQQKETLSDVAGSSGTSLTLDPPKTIS